LGPVLARKLITSSKTITTTALRTTASLSLAGLENNTAMGFGISVWLERIEHLTSHQFCRIGQTIISLSKYISVSLDLKVEVHGRFSVHPVLLPLSFSSPWPNGMRHRAGRNEEYSSWPVFSPDHPVGDDQKTLASNQALSII
jgi:hypothetical protein